MLKKIIAGMLLLATLTFGMSLSKLNSASKAELMAINGIGEVKAAALIKERRKSKFKSFADLQERVEGIGEQTAANIKGDVKNAKDVKKVAKKTKSKAKSKAKSKTAAKSKAKAKAKKTSKRAKSTRKKMVKAEDANTTKVKKKRKTRKKTKAKTKS